MISNESKFIFKKFASDLGGTLYQESVSLNICKIIKILDVGKAGNSFKYYCVFLYFIKKWEKVNVINEENNPLVSIICSMYKGEDCIEAISPCNIVNQTYIQQNASLLQLMPNSPEL